MISAVLMKTFSPAGEFRIEIRRPVLQEGGDSPARYDSACRRLKDSADDLKQGIFLPQLSRSDPATRLDDFTAIHTERDVPQGPEIRMQRLVAQWIQLADAIKRCLVQPVELSRRFGRAANNQCVAAHIMETMRLPLASALAVVVGLAAGLATGFAPHPRRLPYMGTRSSMSTPHDHNAFTQGLEYRDGFLYEGTGLNGKSSLRKVDLESGKVLRGDPAGFAVLSGEVRITLD